MSVLSWGKPTIKYATSTNGAPSEQWTELDTPKIDSTNLETTEGDSKEAKEEGGAVVDAVYDVADYTLKFTLFVKKVDGGEFQTPLSPVNGKVNGEYAFQVIPEDPQCSGIQIDKSRVTVLTTYNSNDGIELTYTCRALRPASGDIVKIKKIS